MIFFCNGCEGSIPTGSRTAYAVLQQFGRRLYLDWEETAIDHAVRCWKQWSCVCSSFALRVEAFTAVTGGSVLSQGASDVRGVVVVGSFRVIDVVPLKQMLASVELPIQRT